MAYDSPQEEGFAVAVPVLDPSLAHGRGVAVSTLLGQPLPVPTLCSTLPRAGVCLVCAHPSAEGRCPGGGEFWCLALCLLIGTDGVSVKLIPCSSLSSAHLLLQSCAAVRAVCYSAAVAAPCCPLVAGHAVQDAC